MLTGYPTWPDGIRMARKLTLAGDETTTLAPTAWALLRWIAAVVRASDFCAEFLV